MRRVKDARYPDALFPVWRYHPFFTDIDLPVDQADITHRRHAINETVFAENLEINTMGCMDINRIWGITTEYVQIVD